MKFLDIFGVGALFSRQCISQIREMLLSAECVWLQLYVSVSAVMLMRV